MTGPKTNEREGTRAVLRHAQISPFKVRPVLDLVRGQHVQLALETLRFTERDAGQLVAKLLASAVANAANNDGIDPEELFVSACYADEAGSLRRFRYRARGRPGRIRKRRSHVTVIVSRLPEDQLARFRQRRAAEQAAMRSRRVEAGRRGGRRGQAEEAPVTPVEDEVIEAAPETETVEEPVAAVVEAPAEATTEEVTDTTTEETPEAAAEEEEK